MQQRTNFESSNTNPVSSGPPLLFLLVCLLLVCLLAVPGCIGGLKRDDVVKAPDAPMLITSVDGKKLGVSVYDSKTNALIEYDERITVSPQLEGWTLSKFDWEGLIRDRMKKSEGETP